MNWICILHFYQPPFQKKRILEQIVNECYLPLTNKLLQSKGEFTLYFNINKSLIEQLTNNNHTKVIHNIKELIRQGRVKLCQTPSYHPIIPLIDPKIVKEQIRQNDIVLAEHFGVKDFDLFFSPELALVPGEHPSFSRILTSQNSLLDDKYTPFVNFKDINYIVRHKNMSNMIMGGAVRTFKNLDFEELGIQDTFVTAVDAETFGHHRKGYEDVLVSLISELPSINFPVSKTKFREVKNLRSSSWSTTDFKKPFNLWKDNTNDIHKMLWEFIDYLTKLKAEGKVDIDTYHKSFSSCTFWWASANPWWSLDMIDNGAWLMYESIVPIYKKEKLEGYKRYSQIVLEAIKWQRQDKIEKKFLESDITKKVPFKDRATNLELKEYLKRFNDAEKEAVKHKNYELAIRWRDARDKIVKGNDKYDDWHVVDQLGVFSSL